MRATKRHGGWFAVKRGITDHPIFRGQPERLAIWIWLLDNVAWADTTQDLNGVTVTVPRGCVSASERRIADEVGVGRQVVRTFLARLEADSMLARTITQGRNLIRLCNWDKYQVPENDDNPAKNPGLTHDQPIKRTREQDITLEPNGSSDADASDPVPFSILSKTVWDTALRILAMHGTAEKQARSLIGKWCKDSDHPTILAALDAFHRSGSRDPISYITAALRPQPTVRSASDIAEQLRREGRL